MIAQYFHTSFSILFAIFFYLLPILFLSACAPPKPQPVDAAKAQQMVFEEVTRNKSPETVASYTVLGSRAGFDGHVIAYWMCQPAELNNPAISQYGYVIVRRYYGQQGTQAAMHGGARLPAAGSLIEFAAHLSEDQTGKLNIVLGRILSPQVQAVEVVYADQQSLRWPAGGEGFLLFRRDPVDWTHLNVLGENDQVLKTYDLSMDTHTLSEREEGSGTDCPDIQ